MQAPTIIVNGQACENITVLDRGLLYGDGLFETMAVRHGSVRFLEDHLHRLQTGCQVLGLTGLDLDTLKKEVARTINADKECIIKVIITRGTGDRGYRPVHQALTRIVQKFPWPVFPQAYQDRGIDITLCKFRLSHQPRLAQIKHLNRLEQVLARSEWEDEFQEGLVCDAQDHVIEATASNVFFEANGGLVTPDLSQCGVAGVLRGQIIRYCQRHNIELSVRAVSLGEAAEMDAMFICNCIIGIWPVKRFDSLQFSRSELTGRLMSVFNQ
ncbi:MAG: aminodeoxychorismate lyase [Proteobacteria bacterium]|nr:aminodeoxychorismate lyase [Pseudomonadota bacterium]